MAMTCSDCGMMTGPSSGSRSSGRNSSYPNKHINGNACHDDSSDNEDSRIWAVMSLVVAGSQQEGWARCSGGSTGREQGVAAAAGAAAASGSCLFEIRGVSRALREVSPRGCEKNTASSHQLHTVIAVCLYCVNSCKN